MGNFRLIPILSTIDNKLVKTLGFKDPKYLGDPINALKIFNDKYVDELVISDIRRSSTGASEPNYELIENVANEAFMPLAYAGGIGSLEQAKKVFDLGIEKVVINSAAFTDLDLITSIGNMAGNQSVVVSIDVGKNWLGKRKLFTRSGKNAVKGGLDEWIPRFESAGAGEIFLHSISSEGTFKGLDRTLCLEAVGIASVPVIAAGGCIDLADAEQCVAETGIHAVAASSMMVFQKRDRDSILISYPRKLGAA